MKYLFPLIYIIIGAVVGVGICRITSKNTSQPEVIYKTVVDTVYVERLKEITISVPREIKKEDVAVTTKEERCISSVTQHGAEVNIGLRYYLPSSRTYVTTPMVIRMNDYWFLAAEAGIGYNKQRALRIGFGRTFLKTRLSVAALAGTDGAWISLRYRF